MSEDQPVALRAHITPEQVLHVLGTRREQAKAAAHCDRLKADSAKHQAEITQAVSWAVSDLTQEIEAKVQECLDGVKAAWDDGERNLSREERGLHSELMCLLARYQREDGKELAPETLARLIKQTEDTEALRKLVHSQELRIQQLVEQAACTHEMTHKGVCAGCGAVLQD